jgi:hypothetical protein
MNSPDQGRVPFGPEVSWPGGYSNSEYQNGDYRHAAQQSAQLPAASQGAHPYASFNGAGYGDDGYTDPGYQGPAAQDAGIAGTRTVRGFVESDRGQGGYPLSAPVDAGYGQSGYGQPGYPPQALNAASPRDDYAQPGYAGAGYPGYGEIELAYPPAAADGYQADLYSQPWDYDQPLRYDGEPDAYPAPDNYRAAGDHARSGGYGALGDEGAVRYQPPAFDPAAYNGSDYSMPGINGPGYDLSGIIGTNDFEAIGYDEPSYGRLSYDDPRYNEPRHGDTPGYPGSGPRFEETRFDVPRFDETRLDNLWAAGDDVRREASQAGYGNNGFGDSRSRSDSPSAFDPGPKRGRRAAETRYDMRALTEAADSTRFDVPVFDETRLDNLRPLTPGRGMRAVGTAVLAPPAAQPRSWAEDTSLDHFADLDLTDEPVPAAFTRTLDRPQQDDDTATRRAIGRRRGRSGDRRQWMALGAIAVVAAGAIGGVLMKYVFSGPSGPAHSVVAPQTVDGFTRSANLEKQLQVSTEAQKVAAASGGQASSVVSAVYQQGSISSTSGSDAQIFMFVGGKLAGADPGASVTNFEQTYAGSKAVSAGSMAGEAACTETHLNGQSASMCVWFDNDTFGTVVSPTMTTAKLAATMDAVRPSLELLAK